MTLTPFSPSNNRSQNARIAVACVHSQGETIEEAEKNVMDALKTLVAHKVETRSKDA